MKDAVIAVLALTLLIGFPLATIWALNTLFALAIPYTIETWASVAVLITALGMTR